jgi:hypothetical protein
MYKNIIVYPTFFGGSWFQDKKSNGGRSKNEPLNFVWYYAAQECILKASYLIPPLLMTL